MVRGLEGEVERAEGVKREKERVVGHSMKGD
jgi:hypothetical protein